MIRKGEITHDANVRLERGHTIRGVVVDQTGQAIADARVTVSETVIDLSQPGITSSFGEQLEARTDAQGLFELAGLSSEEYHVTA